MIIDCNAYLGHYPFRRLRLSKPEGMLAAMDRYGIRCSVVSSLSGVFYRDAHRGNEELAEAIRKWPERFAPVAIVNPRYVGWERDLDHAVDGWRMRAVSLYPSYHGFRLLDDYGVAAIKAIEERGVPLVLTQRLEDRRQRHHWDQAEDLEWKELLEVATRFPKLRFLLRNWSGVDGTKLAAAGLRGRCLIDFARLHVLLLQDVPKLVDSMGIESIVFGSHAPFDYFGPSIVKLSNMKWSSDEAWERVLWRNAADFLQIEPR